MKQNEVEDSMRRIYLAKMKQDDRLNHLKEVSPCTQQPCRQLTCSVGATLLLLNFRLSVGGNYMKSMLRRPRRKRRREKLKRRKRGKRG